jgi:hypothetical protein
MPDVSPRWAGIGHSQGGGAIWSANEQAAGYTPELQLVGTAAMSPAADLTGMVDKAQQGKLTTDQFQALQWTLASLARLHPDLNLDDYRRGVAAEHWDELSACIGYPLIAREEAVHARGPFDLGPATPEAADKLRALLQKWALPQGPLTAPLSVAYGDNDETIDYEWTSKAIERACALGGTIDITLEHGRGHPNIDVTSQFKWVIERFLGQPAVNECKK